jgi:glycerate 2-kinase
MFAIILIIMPIIKNFDQLASTPQRKVVLELIESAFESIKPQHVLDHQFSIAGDVLTIQDKTFDLKNYEQVFLIGFGKGSFDVCKIIADKLGNKLSLAYDIDVVDEFSQNIQYTKGTHPLPSEENIDYTKTLVERFSGNLTEKDLVLIVVCGGGSVLFEMPHTIDLPKLIEVNKALLRSGATISEMNVIRKHLSATKGGGFARMLYPATVASLIFSDVPGNDLNVIASGPTVKDPSTMQQVHEILEKYALTEQLQLSDDSFQETPKEDMYFEHVHNLMVLSNQTALEAMQKKAKELGYEAFIFSDRVQGDAKSIGALLLNNAQPGKILLAAGETTVKVSGNGKGGRNQESVLAAVPLLDEKTVIASFDSDGQDFFVLAGAIADSSTMQKAKERNLDWKKYLDDNDGYDFWETVGDGILTGKLESNVSDLMIVMKE